MIAVTQRENECSRLAVEGKRTDGCTVRVECSGDADVGADDRSRHGSLVGESCVCD